jgi:hypothetical protein
LLNRANMRRRKITTDDKKIPIQSEIVRIMGIGQNLMKEKGLFPHQILNMDETGHTYAVGPDKMYIPPDQSRAQNIGVANDKLRITAVVAVFGTGEFAPLFLIIKHSVSSLQGINDLFDLFANGFQETKFREGVNRSFISTGCLPIYNTDPTVYNFVPYTQQKTCGTMKIIPTGTRNHSDTDLHSNTNSNTVAASADENADILYAIDSYLDYDSDDENAMNALLNL